MRNNRRSFLLREFPSAALASAAAWSGLAQEQPEELVAHNAKLDIGHFARVTTSDATRVQGARAARRLVCHFFDLSLLLLAVLSSPDRPLPLRWE